MERKLNDVYELTRTYLYVMTRYSLKKLNEKLLYRGWLPVDDDVDAPDHERLKLESVVVAVATSTSVGPDPWIGLLSSLYALSVAHQTCHWKSCGEPFYGDHLMFQRMYDETVKEIDSVAEKYVGVTGDSTCLDAQQLLSSSAEAAKKMLATGDCYSTMLGAEKTFINAVERMLRMLKDENKSSSGIENLLQAIVDTHESHVYLLGRRTANRQIKAIVKTV